MKYLAMLTLTAMIAVASPASLLQADNTVACSTASAQDNSIRTDIVRASFELQPDKELEFVGNNVRKVHVYNASGSTLKVRVYKGGKVIYSTSVRPGMQFTEKGSLGKNGMYRITIQNGVHQSDVYVHIERR